MFRYRDQDQYQWRIILSCMIHDNSSLGYLGTNPQSKHNNGVSAKDKSMFNSEMKPRLSKSSLCGAWSENCKAIQWRASGNDNLASRQTNTGNTRRHWLGSEVTVGSGQGLICFGVRLLCRAVIRAEFHSLGSWPPRSQRCCVMCTVKCMELFFFNSLVNSGLLWSYNEHDKQDGILLKVKVVSE